ncbi:hypothetical protein D3C76_862950 [compost metagenome]|uniref:hypothetical protein n=1 Tax=Pseudomonas asiatica TaxID=2219225 RepID=UPI000FB1D33C|nr:hypothetical protein [Pseudomonas asiatica]
MAKTKIVRAPKPDCGFYGGTIKNTGLDQRATLEEIMVNLATVLGIKEIYKADTARGSTIYEPQGKGFFYSYQSASNTILDLSRDVAKRAADAKKQAAVLKKTEKPVQQPSQD